MRTHQNDQRGFIMIVCLTLLLMFGMLGVSTVMHSTSDMDVAGNQLRDANALYAAEAGAEKAYALFRTTIDSTAAPPNPLPSGNFDLDRYHVSYSVTATGAAVQRNLTSGPYTGLFGLVTEYDLWGNSRGSTGVDNAVRIRMERALIPIFQFAIFYDDQLEWHPGPPMSLNGRVHSNGDTYLGSHNGLDIDSWLTAAGRLFHGRGPGSGQALGTGAVRIKDSHGNYQDMANGDGTWLDHDDGDWLNQSTVRWGGRVQDVAHGVSRLSLPLETSDDPISIIKSATGGNTDSYENKANLKIIDGQAFFKSAGGTWSDVTAAMIAEGSLSTSTFYDAREHRTVNAVNIDISKLNTSLYWPTNGIVYARQTQGAGNLMGTRLINGSTLKTGLTVVSDNPLYTQGNYNSVSKKPAALMGDAYTILSDSWSDAASSGALSGRIASSTTVNAAFISGNTNTGGGNYNGGVENFPRFLEDWNTKTLTWKGSMVQLWQSQYASSAWSYGIYYNAPNRTWSFDTDFLNAANLPPGTPVVNVVVKKGWSNTGVPLAGS
jgi:hypothetical protein